LRSTSFQELFRPKHRNGKLSAHEQKKPDLADELILSQQDLGQSNVSPTYDIGESKKC